MKTFSIPMKDMPRCARANFLATVEVFGMDGKTTFLYPGFVTPDAPDAPQSR